MDKSEYQNLKSEIRKTYDEAVSEAERERDQNIAALERVWKLAQRTNGYSSPQEDTVGKNDYEGFWPDEKPKTMLDSAIESIREIVAEMNQEFSFRDVLTRLKQKHPNSEIPQNTVSGTLKRLHENGEIVLVKAGRGRRPSVYAKKGDNNTEMDVTQNGE